ncbi:hypothetical protein C8F04DRAFT_1185621 [Mycena alexandri]|uniref:Uncharacterized protein n=1 Tax=Mycena alexandri TaxID=1745969 RepID=A0AAD6X4C0_9AGAR|nr:hypothetical protein C8F04DRAFT_1185621 [Mycena alexandri]
MFAILLPIFRACSVLTPLYISDQESADEVELNDERQEITVHYSMVFGQSSPTLKEFPHTTSFLILTPPSHPLSGEWELGDIKGEFGKKVFVEWIKHSKSQTNAAMFPHNAVKIFLNDLTDMGKKKKKSQLGTVEICSPRMSDSHLNGSQNIKNQAKKSHFRIRRDLRADRAAFADQSTRSIIPGTQGKSKVELTGRRKLGKHSKAQ